MQLESLYNTAKGDAMLTKFWCDIDTGIINSPAILFHPIQLAWWGLYLSTGRSLFSQDVLHMNKAICFFFLTQTKISQIIIGMLILLTMMKH